MRCLFHTQYYRPTLPNVAVLGKSKFERRTDIESCERVGPSRNYGATVCHLFLEAIQYTTEQATV